MKAPRSFRSALLALVPAMLALPLVRGQNELLLPFPNSSAAEEESGSEAALRENAPTGSDEHHRRAIEIAETFIQRQQMEVASSVPRRGEPAPRVPTRKVAAFQNAPIMAAVVPTADAPAAGPYSELLPMPPEAANWGDAAMLPGGESEFLPVSGDVPGETPPSKDAVPVSALSAAPAFGDLADQERRGPVFRIPGDQAYAVAKARGFKFSPAGGIGARDGTRTAASQFPHMITSEVNGTLMAQVRPPQAWEMNESSNTFFMFCDASYKSVLLNSGWRIRGINLDGPNWRWVACPRSGSPTASFSVRLYSYRGAASDTTVKIVHLTLEGPPGATDWKQAFPSLNGKGPALEVPDAMPPGDAMLAASELPRGIDARE